jgi:hypothetical protein
MVEATGAQDALPERMCSVCNTFFSAIDHRHLGCFVRLWELAEIETRFNNVDIVLISCVTSDADIIYKWIRRHGIRVRDLTYWVDFRFPIPDLLLRARKWDADIGVSSADIDCLLKLIENIAPPPPDRALPTCMLIPGLSVVQPHWIKQPRWKQCEDTNADAAARVTTPSGARLFRCALSEIRRLRRGHVAISLAICAHADDVRYLVRSIPEIEGATNTRIMLLVQPEQILFGSSTHPAECFLAHLEILSLS